MQGAELTSQGDVLDRLDAALAASPADETEIVFHEVARAAAGSPGARPAAPPARERGVLVRVFERGRMGVHRTGAGSPGELDNAVRHALAQAKVDPPPAHRPPLTPKGPPLDPPEGSRDPALAGLTPEAGAALLGERLERDERGRLEWAEMRIVAANSRGLRRAAEVTAVTLTVRSGGDGAAGRDGDGAGAGWAAASARSLAALAAGEVIERARSRRAGDDAAGSLGVGPAAVLSPEAVARLIELFAHHALSARSFHDGTSPLRAALGEQALDPALTLIDRPGDPAGLPFPFDFFGAGKEPLAMIEAGVLRTPAVDSELAPALGLLPTHHAIGPDDARPGNLFLTAGALDLAGLLAAAGDGVWIGWLDDLRCFDPGGLRFRATARGLREIRGGRLGGPLPDRPWEGRLLDLLSRVAGLGAEPVCHAAGDGVLEAVTTPALALPGPAGGWA